MWLRIAHFIGLTNLSKSQVEAYCLKTAHKGTYSYLHVALVFSTLAAVLMLTINIHTRYEMRELEKVCFDRLGEVHKEREAQIECFAGNDTEPQPEFECLPCLMKSDAKATAKLHHI